MANSKISGLTSATTPLAGTEELVILQTSDKRITASNMAVGAIKSNATTGIMQITGPAAASTRVVTVPDANWTAARTDAAQSFTGDQTLSTGNLVVGTSGKGIDFSTTGQADGMTSELLNDYEEGTWEPTQGAQLTVVGAFTSGGAYTKIGNVVVLKGYIAGATSVACTANGAITGAALPFAASNVKGYAMGCGTNAASTLATGVQAYSSTVYCAEAFTATPRFDFTVTYNV